MQATTRSAPLAVLIALLAATSAAPSTPFEALLSELLDATTATKLGDPLAAASLDNDYDLHYDQRQTGSENYRLNVDGIMLTVPAASEQAMGSIGSLATNYLLDLAAATAALEGEDDDDDDDGGVDAVEEEADDRPPHDHQHQHNQHKLPSKPPASAYKYEKLVQAVDSKRSEAERLLEATDRVRRPAAGGSLGDSLAAFVQQSRNNPMGNGPAKKRVKHKLRLGSLIEYLQKRNQPK